MSAPNMGQMGGYNQLMQQAPQGGQPPANYLAMLQQGAQGQGMNPQQQGRPPMPPSMGQRLGGALMGMAGNPPGSPTNGMGQPGGMGMRPSPQAQTGTPNAQAAMGNPFMQALAQWQDRQQAQGQAPGQAPGQMGQRPGMPPGGAPGPQWGPPVSGQTNPQNPMGPQPGNPQGPPGMPPQGMSPQWGPPVSGQRPPGM